ncbi:MAG TPA: M20/M25/M40 family metallo-hydrolase [Bryobacteraceae bacterium]|nr:M20/M25/M40 family metallo-hydrolase [Bryobacteraceae bacterium]
MPLLTPSVAGLAASANARACLNWFRQERAWINEQHLALCGIPAPTFFEQKRAAYMAEQFRALGWEAKIDRAGNVVATLPGHENTPCIAVTAHLDTVFAPRSPDEIRVSAEGRLLGPGVADNGAGLAALLAIAAAWMAARPIEDSPLAPVLVANVGEEGEGNLSGMRYFCRQASSSKLRGFLVLDGPSAEHITSRALASRRFDVTITGPGGHSWRDFGAPNPVHVLSRAVTLFTDQARVLPPDASSVNGSVQPRTTFNFGIFEGGSSINSIPSEARAKIDLRSEDEQRIGQMAALLEASVDEAVETENARGNGGRVTARVKEIGSRPSGALPHDAPILECMRAVDAHLGIRSHLDCSSTDANVPLSLGLPAVSIGAGGQGAGAHTASEWYLPDGRELGLRRIMLALCLLLAGE